jgi:hypothetical protein
MKNLNTKIIYPAAFISMGVRFLLISTIFYPAISQWLLQLQDDTSIAAPSFWSLAFVLAFVRIIFIIVGVFLTGFGIFLCWKKVF